MKDMKQPVFVTFDIYSAVLKEEGTRGSVAYRYGISEGSVQRIRKTKKAVDALSVDELKKVCLFENLPAWAFEFGKREIKHRKDEERKTSSSEVCGEIETVPVPVKNTANGTSTYDLYDIRNELRNIRYLAVDANKYFSDANAGIDDMIDVLMRIEKQLVDVKDILVRVEYNTRKM